MGSEWKVIREMSDEPANSKMWRDFYKHMDVIDGGLKHQAMTINRNEHTGGRQG
jgi:hypothetical protein